MPGEGETALAKVSKYDFFAILGSGSYVVGCCGLLFAAVSSRNQNLTTQEAIKWLSGTIEHHWPLAVASLFLAFLIGNVLRALPVNRADNWWERWWFAALRTRLQKRKETNSPYQRNLRKGPFPYPAVVFGELEAMKRSLLVRYPSVSSEIQKDLGFDSPNKTYKDHKEAKETEETWHSAYNFWKAELCRESATAFEYTQELEGRVRLFATMIWASLLGLSAGVIGLLLTFAGPVGNSWIIVMFI